MAAAAGRPRSRAVVVEVVVAAAVAVGAVLGGGRVVGADCVQQGPCSCQSPKGLIDLSPLDGHGSPRFKDQKTQSPTDAFLYSWNPCSPFSELQGCQSVAACQVTSDQTLSYAVGTQDTAQFTTDPTTGYLTLQYTATDPQTGVTRSLVVSLTCDPTDVPGTLTVVGEGPPLSYAMSLNSHYCCPGAEPQGGGSKGFSIGSILVIVFFAILVVYIVAGVLFLKFVRKAEGKELIPNYSLWSALPGVIKDGTVFTFRGLCSLCGRRGTYDKV